MPRGGRRFTIEFTPHLRICPELCFKAYAQLAQAQASIAKAARELKPNGLSDGLPRYSGSVHHLCP
jgi:hypothetical protein